MKKLELKDTIETDLPKNEVYERIIDFFKLNQIKLKKMNTHVITGIYGSRVKAHTRGFRFEPSILPVKILIELHDKENLKELQILLKKGYIGITILGMSKKYSMIFARLMNSLKLQFYKKMYLKKETSKCNNCGTFVFYENQRFCERCGYELLKNLS